jgi:hypothetical protein
VLFMAHRFPAARRMRLPARSNTFSWPMDACGRTVGALVGRACCPSAPPLLLLVWCLCRGASSITVFWWWVNMLPRTCAWGQQKGGGRGLSSGGQWAGGEGGVYSVFSPCGACTLCERIASNVNVHGTQLGPVVREFRTLKTAMDDTVSARVYPTCR